MNASRSCSCSRRIANERRKSPHTCSMIFFIAILITTEISKFFNCVSLTSERARTQKAHILILRHNWIDVYSDVSSNPQCNFFMTPGSINFSFLLFPPLDSGNFQYCEEPRLGLNQLNDATDGRRAPLQDEDLPGSNPQSVPGFPRSCPGMFPEMFRSASVSVGSKEICLI